MSDPVQLLRQFIAARPEVRRWLVAYSGGLDSSLLLHCLAAVVPASRCAAVHVHHNLSPRADAWQQHCRRTCAELGVEFITVNVQLRREGKGLEDAAREARYGVFAELLQRDDGLLMAHHQDDQAETLLLRLLRGSGPAGLAAMPDERRLGQGMLYRPWLSLQRQQIRQQALQQQLSWVEDESNLSPQFDRNYLRHQVLPQLRQRWPGFGARWQQSAALCGQYQQLAEQVAAADLQAAGPRGERCGQSLDLAALQSLDAFRRGNLLRHWLAGLGMALPDQVHLQQIESQLLGDRASSEAEVRWAGQAMSRFRQRLYVLPQLQPRLSTESSGESSTESSTESSAESSTESSAESSAESSTESSTESLTESSTESSIESSTESLTESPAQHPTGSSKELPTELRWSGLAPLAWGDWQLSLQPVARGGFDIPATGFVVARRVGGERCQPHWRNHSQSLKKLLQEVDLEPWLRQQVPLLKTADGSAIVAVGDLWVNKPWHRADGGYQLQWQFSPAT